MSARAESDAYSMQLRRVDVGVGVWLTMTLQHASMPACQHASMPAASGDPGAHGAHGVHGVQTILPPPGAIPSLVPYPSFRLPDCQDHNCRAATLPPSSPSRTCRVHVAYMSAGLRTKVSMSSARRHTAHLSSFPLCRCRRIRLGLFVSHPRPASYPAWHFGC